MRTVTLNQEECIGCGTCEGICPQVFRLNPDTEKSEVILSRGGDEDLIQQAIDSCPAECIQWAD